MAGDQGIIKIGPGGLQNVTSVWDAKGHSEIVQIFISHDQKEINSIQFQYFENGNLVLSEQHGQLSKFKFDVVTFNYPEEYFTSISGTYGQKDIVYSHVTSISFSTNLKKYGPFGRSHDNNMEFHYNIGNDRRQFGGFYGSSTSCVNSIGVYFKPLTTLGDHMDNNNRQVKREL